jgi:hypothetical protein
MLSVSAAAALVKANRSARLARCCPRGILQREALAFIPLPFIKQLHFMRPEAYACTSPEVTECCGCTCRGVVSAAAGAVEKRAALDRVSGGAVAGAAGADFAPPRRPEARRGLASAVGVLVASSPASAGSTQLAGRHCAAVMCMPQLCRF